jgi:tetratricopeptide (TPR) repeat protein
MSFAAAVEAAEQLQEEFPGEQAIEATSMLVRVFAALNDGRRDAARELAPKCLELFRRAGYPIWAGANTAMVGLQELFAGDIDEAERLVVEGIAELEQLNERLFRGLAETFLTHIRVTQGRHREALELVAEAERNSGPDDRRTAVYANTARARAYAGLGDIDQARAAALTAVSIANASGSWLHQGTAHHVLAETLAAAEEWSPALAAAEEAVRRYATLDRTILKARATALAAQIKHQMTLST